jgi:hypothetical protein
MFDASETLATPLELLAQVEPGPGCRRARLLQWKLILDRLGLW